MSDYLLELAAASLGIYPAAVEKDGVITPRSEYGNGWNAAVSALRKQHVEFIVWKSSLAPSQRDALDCLYASERLELYADDGLIMHLGINMNDVFIPAAVTEDITVEDLIPLAKMYTDFGDDGIIAWMSDRYTCPPRPKRVGTRYAEALKALGR